MSDRSTIPGDLDATPESIEKFTRAFAELPPEAAAVIVARLEAGIRHAERTGDIAPALHILESVVMTARLQHNEAYLLAVAEADAEDARGEHDLVDVADFVAEMRAKYGS